MRERVRDPLLPTAHQECGGKRVDVRPNWNEQPEMPTKLRFDSAKN
jgi:hypothetical protein